MGRSYVAEILCLEKLFTASITACYLVIFLSFFCFLTNLLQDHHQKAQCNAAWFALISPEEKKIYLKLSSCEKKSRLMKLQSNQIFKGLLGLIWNHPESDKEHWFIILALVKVLGGQKLVVVNLSPLHFSLVHGWCLVLCDVSEEFCHLAQSP